MSERPHESDREWGTHECLREPLGSPARIATHEKGRLRHTLRSDFLSIKRCPSALLEHLGSTKHGRFALCIDCKQFVVNSVDLNPKDQVSKTLGRSEGLLKPFWGRSATDYVPRQFW